MSSNSKAPPLQVPAPRFHEVRLEPPSVALRGKTRDDEDGVPLDENGVEEREVGVSPFDVHGFEGLDWVVGVVGGGRGEDCCQVKDRVVGSADRRALLRRVNVDRERGGVVLPSWSRLERCPVSSVAHKDQVKRKSVTSMWKV